MAQELLQKFVDCYLGGLAHVSRTPDERTRELAVDVTKKYLGKSLSAQNSMEEYLRANPEIEKEKNLPDVAKRLEAETYLCATNPLAWDLLLTVTAREIITQNSDFTDEDLAECVQKYVDAWPERLHPDKEKLKGQLIDHSKTRLTHNLKLRSGFGEKLSERGWTLEALKEQMLGNFPDGKITEEIIEKAWNPYYP